MKVETMNEKPAYQDQSAPVRAGEGLDENRLTAYLSRQLGGNGPLAVEQFPCGHSNLTYRVTWGSREMVLRRPPFGSKVKTAHDMGREYRVLSQLHSAYPLAPRTILYCEDVEVLGAPFYLMEPIRGVILRRDLPPETQLTPAMARRLSEAFVDNLVRLHHLDYCKVGLGSLGKPQGYLERQVTGWIGRYHNSATHDLPDVAFVSSWFHEHLPAHSRVTLIHNDYKYDNLVLDPGDLSHIIGVLDWEMCTLGDPLSDLGTALAYWANANDSQELQQIRSVPTTLPGTLTRSQLVHRYALATGCDMRDIVFYLAFARFKVAVIIQQIYYRFAQGLTKDARFAAMPRRVEVLVRASRQGVESGVI